MNEGHVVDLDASNAEAGRLLELEARVAQLQQALESRVVIEQAKGILAERLMVGVDEAFDLLRYAARSHRTKLHGLAARVVEERATPTPVVLAIAKSARLRASWMRELAEAHHARVEELRAGLVEQAVRLGLDRPPRENR